MTRTKAPQLTLQKQRRVAKYKEKFPQASFYEVADEFAITYDQARNACIKKKKGLLDRKSKPRFKQPKIDEIIANNNPDELLDRQYLVATAGLDADTKLPYEERIKILDTLFSMRKTLQQVRLENHIKRADSQIIAAIIRRYEPEASDERVITVYREELEKWKIKP